MVMFWRVFLAVSAITALVTFLFVILALLQFNRIGSELARERVAVLADRTAAPFEAATRIGLPLSAVRNADPILERARQLDEAITAIHVIGTGGELLRSTAGQRPQPQTQTLALFARPGAGEARNWSGETATGFFSATGIRDMAGRPAGAIVIEYSGSDSRTRLWAMAAQLVVGGIVFVLLATLAAGAILRLLLRREVEAFEEVETDIAAFERQSWRREAGETASRATGGALFRLLDETDARYRYAVAAAGGEGGKGG